MRVDATPEGPLGAPRTAQTSAGLIRAHERGSGPALVFFHEFPTGAATWRQVVPRLADVARCVVPEWPYGSHSVPLHPDAGLGLPDLIALAAETIVALGAAPATLVGSGGGGTLCQLLALRHPELVERLVVTTGDALWSFPAPMLRPFPALARVAPLADAFVQACRVEAVQRWWFSLLAHRPPPRAVRRAYVASLAADADVRRDFRRAIGGIDTGWARAHAERLGELAVPTLVVWARDDRFFGLRHGRRLAATLPDARLVELRDCRTLIGEDQPERLAGLIRDFLAETDEVSGSGSARWPDQPAPPRPGRPGRGHRAANPGPRYVDGRYVAERRGNPLVQTPAGGRLLSAAMLPWFTLMPPKGCGVLTTTGRRTGKTRRRCVRVIRHGDRAYVVAIGGEHNAWLKNVRANPRVHLRLRGGSYDAVARELHDPDERVEAQAAYCDAVTAFDVFESSAHRRGRPSRAKIVELHRAWFDGGVALVVDLARRAHPPGARAPDGSDAQAGSERDSSSEANRSSQSARKL